MTSASDELVRFDEPEGAASIPGLDHLHAGATDHLRAVAVAAAHAGRAGPVAAHLDTAGRPRQLEFEPTGPGGGRILARTGVCRDPLPALLLRGTAGLVPHALRSPLVRIDGAVTLARRASRRGDTAAADGELARLSEVVRAALERADAHAEAVQRLVDRTPSPVRPSAADGDPADHVRSALDRRVGPKSQLDAGPGSVDAPGADGPAVLATVVLPSPHPVPPPTLDRLLTHLTETWGVRRLRMVTPGHAEVRSVPDQGSGPPAVDAARWWDGRPDPDLPLALGRRWVGGDGSDVVEALVDAAALVDGGVSVHLVAPVDAPGWELASCPRPWVVHLPAVIAGWQQPLDAGVEVVSLGRSEV